MSKISISCLTLVLFLSLCFQCLAVDNEKWDPDVDVAVFIIIGQSNADGSAFFNDSIDRRMRQWYESDANTGKMKVWYRSSQVFNNDRNALGEAARWVVDGDVTDVSPGWLDLWYRNENTDGRTSMTMIHDYGTYSTGSGRNCAQGRRGMEGEFGRAFNTAFPEMELYVLKLGASGSYISSWANPMDDTNWKYFHDNIFQPAISDLIAKGKRPHLVGAWWMQGCADASKPMEYCQQCLGRLAERIETELGFKDGTLYVGYVPQRSVQFGKSVRKAQDAAAKEHANIEIVDTDDFDMQYEKPFHGYIHFSHAGQNAIGAELARRVIAAGPDSWPTLNENLR